MKRLLSLLPCKFILLCCISENAGKMAKESASNGANTLENFRGQYNCKGNETFSGKVKIKQKI